MKKHLFLLFAAFALLLPGCASTPNQQAALDLAIDIAIDAAAIVLRRNPEAAPVLQAVSLGIDAILTKGSLTQAQVDDFVAGLDRGKRLKGDDAFIIGRAIKRAHQALVVYGCAPDIDVANPKVREALVRVRDALNGATRF